MNVLLTGATGYLGSHLLRSLISSRCEIVVLKRSFSNVDRISGLLKGLVTYDLDCVDVSQVFDGHAFDAVIHSATNYGRVKADPLQTVEANLLLPLRLLELARRHHVKTFINTDTILDKGVNTYSLSKSQFKDWLKTYSQDLTCCNVALEHFYGPGDDKTKFVSSIIETFLSKTPMIELTPGLQRRDFIYIDDVVDAIMTILVSSEKLSSGYFSYEIGTGIPLTIRHFVELVRELSGNTTTELRFGALPYRTNETMDCETDIAAILALGWKPNYSVIQGLKKTIEMEQKGRLQ